MSQNNLPLSHVEATCLKKPISKHECGKPRLTNLNLDMCLLHGIHEMAHRM